MTASETWTTRKTTIPLTDVSGSDKHTSASFAFLAKSPFSLQAFKRHFRPRILYFTSEPTYSCIRTNIVCKVTVLGAKKSTPRFNLRDENVIATEKCSLIVRDDKNTVTFYIWLGSADIYLTQFKTKLIISTTSILALYQGARERYIGNTTRGSEQKLISILA